MTPYSTFYGALGNSDNIVTMRWPYRSENKGIQDLRSDLATQCLYFHRKFVAEGTNETPNRMYGPIDFPIIRYADVLLMKAEALNESGKTGDAIAEVNKVRQRAGAALLDTSDPTKVSGQEDLRERIRNERRIEFVNEGISYFDELRWGTLKETVYADEKPGAKQVWGAVTRAYAWSSDDRKGYIWPIPQTEIDRNPNLVQNEGWE
ncbi:MAG: RagB/SusD family nutrient uptake outer membrane protein [Bacteroides sp.]|nr:RagB/SusD family nutrient uptake outer membrane protein [Bacteroides sp.]